MTASRSADHFARIYNASQDPWGFDSSPYEQGKYDQTIEALSGRQYGAGLEIGCSIGVLTRRLAGHCKTMLGIDLVEHPLQAARARCADLPGVRFQQMQIPRQWPDGRFDLMVFSEVLYFLTPADIAQCARRVAASLSPGGTVVLVNWLGQSDDPCTGEEAADHFNAAMRAVLRVDRTERHAGYRLDLLAAV